MAKYRAILLKCLFLPVLVLVAGCGGDSSNGPAPTKRYNAVRIDIFGGAPLGGGFVFQLWAAKNPSSATSAGTAALVPLTQFRLVSGKNVTPDTLISVSGQAIPSNTITNLPLDLNEYDSLFITLEQDSVMATNPSATVYLRGSIPSDLNAVSFSGMDFPADVENISGFFRLTTPTDGDATNDTSGIWFLQFGQQAGLTLPVAPPGWRYESWAYHQDVWLSMGRFADPAQGDDFSDYSASDNAAPPFPGEDFVNVGAAPSGVVFPWVFVGGDSVAVTIEPDPDTEAGPFHIRLLEASLSDPVPVLISLPMNRVTNGVPTANVRFERPEEL